jgi:hypothetical protein
MSTEGFMDFTLGTGDDEVGKRSGRFQAKDSTTYRATFVWFSLPKVEDDKIVGWDDDGAFLEDGTLHPDAQVRFTGCERIYKKGVGYILYGGPAYAKFGKPRQAVATVICLWPTNDEGELQVEKFKSGKGWAVMPWIFSPDKYKDIKAKHKRFSLIKHDLSLACPENGAEFQKLSFTPEGENLLQKLMASEKTEYKAVVAKILGDAKAVAAGIYDELARNLTIDEIMEKLGETPGTPTGSHSAKDVDALLDDVL